MLFTHTGLTLSANTNYVVVVKQRGTGSVELNTTTSGGEDTGLGLSDWSIKDKFYWKSGSTWMLKSGSDEALRIIVRGYANTVGDATDATLSALSVSGATLSPAFAAATTNYHAVVANAVSQGTITATTSETTATVEYLDGSDATRTDADTTTAGLQVNLGVGTNIVKVKVTAPDTTTTETYTVNVFRAAVPVACSPASMTNRIWTGNLTVGQFQRDRLDHAWLRTGPRQSRQHNVQLPKQRVQHRLYKVKCLWYLQFLAGDCDTRHGRQRSQFCTSAPSNSLWRTPVVTSPVITLMLFSATSPPGPTATLSAWR